VLRVFILGHPWAVPRDRARQALPRASQKRESRPCGCWSYAPAAPCPARSAAL